MRDVGEAKRQCRLFIKIMKDNRSGLNDAGMAEDILDDLENDVEPTRAHRKRLLKWCHTDGNPYQKGVSMARALCCALYGEILPREG